MTGAQLIREARVQYRGSGRKLATRSASDVADFVRSVVDGDAREYFIVIMLDARHRPIAWQTVSIGTATASIIHPREVFHAAIHCGAVAIVIAHNHPSGDSKPSSEDCAITARLRDCGQLLGIRLLDHVVIGRGEFYSFKEAGRGGLE